MPIVVLLTILLAVGSSQASEQRPGANQRNLTIHPASDLSPDFAPDGTRIAFSSDRDGEGDIFIMNLDGSQPTNLTNHPANDRAPAFTPDGSQIAFISDRDGEGDIFIMDIDGANLQNLSRHPGDYLNLAFSPDGQRIAFGARQESIFDIFLINADGSGRINLSAHPGIDSIPAWSPNGEKLAFVSGRENNFDLYMMNADASHLVRLTTQRGSDSEPAWAPDGRRIAYSSQRGSNNEIFIMDADQTPKPILVGQQIVHIWDLADTAQPGQMTLYNPDADDAIFGTPVAAGDLNMDGLDDLVVSAMAGDGPNNQRINAGDIRVYFSSGRISGRIDLRTPPLGLVTLFGSRSHDLLGNKTAIADLDGDGHNDLLAGAFYADPPQRPDAGILYLVSGTLLTDLHSGSGILDLAEPLPAGVAAISGSHSGSRLGVWFDTGDINGDGFDDILIGAASFNNARNAYNPIGGAADGPNNTRLNAGELYAIFGRAELPQTIDLRNDPPADLMIIYGAEGDSTASDLLGEEIITADISGDGIDDLLIGAFRADGPQNCRPEAGETYVLNGSADLPGTIIDMATPPPGMTVIYGAYSGAISGDAIATGDINRDGLADLFIGVPGDRGPLDRISAGGCVVMAGGPDLPLHIDLRDPNVPVVWIQAAGPFDFAAYWLTSADIDGDGDIDVIPNGMKGDGPDNNRPNAGEIYVLSGRRLADLLKAVPTAIEATLEPAGRPTSFHLEQNWPNPFNAETSIRFQLDAPGPIELALYTLTGQKLRTLAQADFPTGKHAISWDGLDAHGHMAASGVYLYRLRTGKQVQTHKLLLLR